MVDSIYTYAPVYETAHLTLPEEVKELPIVQFSIAFRAANIAPFFVAGLVSLIRYPHRSSPSPLSLRLSVSRQELYWSL